MNKKWFVGKKVSDFSQFNVEGPISGITLLVDDETEYSAGDDSGIVWEITNPYGTQQMANDILNAVKGKEYRGFHADNAVLDPSAELGDGVNVNGGYYMLGYKNVTFGPGHMAEISAPNNGELNHEYPYKSKEERTFSRKLADMRSSITKTREQILLEVSKTYATNESVSSSIQQTADSILSTVSATYATGESVSKVEQTANKINWLVNSGTSESDFSLTDRAIKLVSDTIDLSGFVTFSSLETQGKTTINGSNITTGTLNAELVNIINLIANHVNSKSGNYEMDIWAAVLKLMDGNNLRARIYSSTANNGNVQTFSGNVSSDGTLLDSNARLSSFHPEALAIGQKQDGTFDGIIYCGRILADGDISSQGNIRVKTQNDQSVAFIGNSSGTPMMGLYDKSGTWLGGLSVSSDNKLLLSQLKSLSVSENVNADRVDADRVRFNAVRPNSSQNTLKTDWKQVKGVDGNTYWALVGTTVV